MIESLLYPKKLTEPPQLLVDVDTLFDKAGNLNTSLVGFSSTSSMKKAVNYRLISVGEDGNNTFKFSFIADVTGITRSGYVIATIALPFQDLETEIVNVKCHGWTAAGAAIMGTPNATAEKASEAMVNAPTILDGSMTPPDGHKYLFKMSGSDLENYGAGKQFSSLGSGCSIYFDYINSSGDLKSEFPEIFGSYSTVALEVIIKVKVYYVNLSSGFRLGIAQP